ncbi:hypothetical protein CBM2637_B120067 [Cupriavidus taiwanensis]|nr:hypothetical protein CBM2637_B120067 [Cupriavidus taiwanensis]
MMVMVEPVPLPLGMHRFASYPAALWRAGAGALIHPAYQPVGARPLISPAYKAFKHPFATQSGMNPRRCSG